MSSREDILKQLGQSVEFDLPPVARLGKSYNLDELWERFEMEFKALGGEVKTVDDLAGLSEWRTVLDPDVPAALSDGLLVTTNVWSADVGLTIADYAVAETGTLVLNSGSSRQRLASLTPPHHVVLLQKSRIVATLDDLFDCGFGRTTVMISGPSRTADIEGVLVRGIHGPKRLWVVLI